MAFTLNRRLSSLVDSNGQLNTGKIADDYINGDHIADNVITSAMLHTSFTVSSSNLTAIDTDNVTEGSTNLYFTDARADARIAAGSITDLSDADQSVQTTDNVTFANITATGYLAGPATFTIDPSAVGDNTGTVVIAGNLQVDGTTTTINSTTLTVDDLNITLASGAANAAAANGAGITVDTANASIVYNGTTDAWDFNKGINVDSNTLVVDATNNRVGILNSAPDVSLDIGSSTDAIHVPVGTTAQRPTGANGYFRYNSEDAQFEGYADGAWGAIAGGGGGSAMETDTFTGDGSTTAFTLTSTVANENNLIVFIEGVYQNKADYIASGTTLTFDVAPVNTRKIVVHHVKSSISGSNSLLTSLSGDGSTTAFTLGAAPGDENNTQVFMDGVYQQKDSYSVSGTTLTFDAAPANGAAIEVMSFTQTTINIPAANTVGVTELNLSDGTSGQALVTDGNGTISFSTISGYTDSDVETYLNTSTIYTDATNDRLGIGIALPQAKLHVDGTTIFNTATGAQPVYITRLGNTNESLKIHCDDRGAVFESIQDETADTYGNFIFAMDSGVTEPYFDVRKGTADSASIFRVDGSGNVGIGTDNPGSILDIRKTNSGGVGPTLSLINGASVANGNAVDINMAGNPGGGALAPTGRIRLTENASAIPTLGFHLYDGANLGECMTLHHQGGTTLKLSSYASMFRLKSGAGAVFGHNVEASNNANEIIQSNTGYYGSFIKMYYNKGIAFHTMSSAGTIGDVIDSPSVSGTERMTIDSSGRVTKPYQPSFQARLNANQTGFNSSGSFGLAVGFNVTDYNVGNHYDTSTGLFTAPVAGLYFFEAATYLSASAIQSWYVKNGSRENATDKGIFGSGNAFPDNSTVLRLEANDTVGFHPYVVGNTNVTILSNANHTYFKGYLVG
jgi:hypothetical protein